MNRFSYGLFAVVLLSTLEARALAQTGSAPGARPEARVIQVTAKKFEFNPNVIRVKKGEPVKLIITALDRDHGFKCDAFHINRKLKKGNPTTIEFIADRAGTFPFHCSDFCGMGHHRMKGKVVVEEQ